VVLVKVTETHKWHVSGYVIDVSPKVPHVDAAVYFAEREKRRKDEALLEAPEATGPKTEIRVIEEKVLMKVAPEHFTLHLLGMLLLALGVYSLLRVVIGGADKTVY